MKLFKLITEAWLVILLSLVFGGSLAGVHVFLKSRIEENKLKETLSSIPKLVPGSVKGERVEEKGKIFFKAFSESGLEGFVIPAKGQGFADTIELLAGIDKNKEKITGLYILDQKETPGLGNKICEELWLKQFKGKQTTAALRVVKNSSELKDDTILAVAGATISSESVSKIVVKSLHDFCSAGNNEKEKL